MEYLPWKNGDAVSFSGSVNETGMGWTGNVEQFKAFCSWVDKRFVDIDAGAFREFWEDRHANIRSYSLPHAVREKILSVRPGSDEEYRRLVLALKKAYGERGAKRVSQTGAAGLPKGRH